MDEHDVFTRRGQVVFVGSKGCGKSSLYQCLKYRNPNVVDVTSTSVLVEDWKPFDLETSLVAEECQRYVDQSVLEDDLKATIQVWDIFGQESLWTCQQLCMAKRALFVLVLNVRNQLDFKQLPHWVQMIQAKSMGAEIIVVASNCEVYDQEGCGDILKNIETLENAVLGEIQEEITTLMSLEQKSWVKNRIETLNEISKNRPKIFPTVILTSAVTGKGLSDLRSAILQHIFCDTNSPGSFTRKLSSKEEDLVTRVHGSHSGKRMVMSLKEYNEVASSVGLSDGRELDEATEALEMHGFVSRVHLASAFQNLERTIVIADPCCFANACALIHRDEENPQDFVNKIQKSQLLERFWPTSTRPNDWTLRSAVDDVVSRGIMRESLFPLCWQVWDVDEVDCKQILAVLLKLGVLVDGAPKASYEIELALSYFKNLSVTTRYYLPLLLKLPKTAAQEVWPDKVPDSTISVGWLYNFQQGLSESLILCILAACRNYRVTKTILAYWQYGIVLRLGHVVVRIMAKDRRLVFSARAKIINGNKQALTIAWVTLAHFLYVTESFLSNFPGLYYQVLTSSNDSNASKSIYQLVEESFCGESQTTLWLIPPLGDAYQGTNTHELSVLTWMYQLSGQSTIFISADFNEDIKLLVSHLENHGFTVLHSTLFSSSFERLTALAHCAVLILLVTKSYSENSPQQEDFNQGQSLKKPTIVARCHLGITVDFSNTVTINLDSGVETPGSFDREQLAALTTECCTLAYGTGDIEAFNAKDKHSEATPNKEVLSETIPNKEESLPNMEVESSSPETAQDAQQVAKSDKKKKVQFSDTHNNNVMNNTKCLTDDQIKPLAACTVSAAMVGAAAEHLTRTGNSSPAGGRAANATAKVAHAVAAGNADHAVEAMNEVVKIVDSATAASQRENEYEAMPKSKACVIV